MHGLTGHFIYSTWQDMKTRCYNTKSNNYQRYGLRGITVCDEWLIKSESLGFPNFYNWSIKNGWQEGLTIERIDVNGNYEPGNCRWGTRKEQVRNRRNTIIVKVFGISMPLMEAVEKYSIDNYGLVLNRLNHKWSIEDALFGKVIKITNNRKIFVFGKIQNH